MTLVGRFNASTREISLVVLSTASPLSHSACKFLRPLLLQAVRVFRFTRIVPNKLIATVEVEAAVVLVIRFASVDTRAWIETVLSQSSRMPSYQLKTCKNTTGTASLLSVCVISACLMAIAGCSWSSRSNYRPAPIVFEQSAVHVADQPLDDTFTSFKTPEIERTAHPNQFSQPPRIAGDTLPVTESYSLESIVRIALSDAKILRSLGGQVLSNPQAVTAVYDPLVQSSDPVIGVRAALAAFDANVSASLNHANNDDVFNNSILGGGATEVVQDLTTAELAWQRVSRTGANYTLRGRVAYDSNDNPTSIFASSYAGFWEAQMRQPLLQGQGEAFNAIAGPNARPGFRNTSGILISQLNNDISLARFELGLRSYLDSVIAAYWNLHFAYENVESARLVRNAAETTWKAAKARFDNDLEGGEADNEAQAREQFYQFQQLYIVALNGDRQASGAGVMQAEADLRRLVGLPQNAGALIRPSDQPMAGPTVFDWDSIVNIALDQRVEIRQQAWQVKRRELELLAARNFLLPRLDAVATYRNNGFGDDLTGGGFRFSSLVSDMSTGDHNEWEMGLQMNMPVGFRQAKSAVENAELQLRRERVVLDEQEKQIIHDLGSAVRQTQQSDRSLALAQLRMKAASDTVRARQAAYDADRIPLNQLLEAQRRLSEALTTFHRATVNSQLATESVHRESGRLLANHAVIVNQDLR